MDLGATICIPNGEPLCEKCPLQQMCKGYKMAKQKGVSIEKELPVKTGKVKRRIENRTVFLLEYDGKIAVHKRDKNGLLGGLWEYISTEEHLSVEQVEALLERNDFPSYEMKLCGEAKHIFSHIEWRMIGYYIKLSKEERFTDSDFYKELSWVTIADKKANYAIPSAFRVYDRWIEKEMCPETKRNRMV